MNRIALLRPFGLVVALALLAACTPTRPIFPPTAAVQEVRALPDGRWRVTVRVQNYALRSMHFAHVSLALDIAGRPAGQLQGDAHLDIAETSSDTLDLVITPTAAARTALLADRVGNVAYAIAGGVQAGPTPDALRIFKVSHQGYLSPVPGLPDAWR